MVSEGMFAIMSVSWPMWVSLGLARISYGSLNPKKEVIVRPDINDFIHRSDTNNAVGLLKHGEESIPKSPLPYENIRKDNQPHVLDAFEDHIRGKVDTALLNLFDRDGEVVTVAGLIRKVSVFKTSKKESMATGVIEDPSGRAEITMYPQTWLAHPLDENDIVLLCGRVKTGKILVNSLDKIGEVPFFMKA